MPIPILAILCFVGLFIYAVIGALVGSLAVRIFDKDIKKTHYHSYVRGIAGEPSGDTDGWNGLAAAAAFWPAVLVIGVAICVGIAVFVGPVWMVKSVATYVAKAQVERKENSD